MGVAMAKKRNKTPGVEAQSDRWRVNLPPKYKPLMETLRKRNRRLITEEVCIAIEKYLEEAGLWPPAEGESEESP